MTSLRRGVLRHKPPVDLESKDKFEDLLVFGYACKLFRDDEKALYIDQGKHLIPWMGDENIKIDRYDARGTLFDLKQYEMPQGGYNRYEGLTPEEKHMEELCDEERYFALYKDEEEEAIIKEEEIKRLHQDVSEAVSNEVTYHQVPFSYSNQQDGGDENTVSEPTPQKSLLGELGDAIYVPPPELDLPPDIVVPPTQKLARIIEKTANFISSQGAQMEIVLKAKQANNPMFQFLHFDSALHPFYRHILTAIRSGSYVVSVEEESADVDKTEEKNGKNSVPQTDSSDSEDEHYLHPSLQSGLNQISSANEIPSESIPFVYPPPTVQPIIDKTASYVARNGRSFETVITSKGDSRFMFLKDDHAFHSYYLHKLKTYTEMNGLKFELTVATSLPVDEKNENQIPERKPESEVKSTQEDDEEQLRNERRKKAVLFLNKLRQEKPLSNILSLEDKLEETGDPSDISSNNKEIVFKITFTISASSS
nr:EOG090X07RL [Cyclestheria hislopi]